MWYSVKVLFKCLVNDDAEVSDLFDESIFLIEADSDGQALKKGEKIARKDEVTYKNYENNDVTWSFVKTLGVYEICEEIEDGVEIFSELYRGERSY